MTSDPLELLLTSLADGSVRVIDLSQPLGPKTPVLNLPPPLASAPAVSIRSISNFDDAGPAWRWRELTLGEHTGTHFDAPSHWITGRDLPNSTTDTIDPVRLFGPACVLDCAEQAARDPDFLLTPGFITDWETTHGVIPSGAWVMMRTDWWTRTDPAEFINMRDDGRHTPGFSPDAVRLLAEERRALGLGVETVSTDAGQARTFDPPFPAHSIMLGAGGFGLASLRHLDQLPATGAIVLAAPLRIEDGSGSPSRVIALAPAGDRA